MSQRHVEILRAREAGKSYKQLAKQFGVFPSTCRNVCLIALRGGIEAVERMRETGRMGRKTQRTIPDDAYNRRWLDRLRARSVTNENGCFVWLGPVTDRGYAHQAHRKWKVQAHRIVYRIHHGVDLRTNQLVCHTCDERRCWNVDHLFVGTPADNSLDMVKKGRCHEWSVTQCPKGHPYDEQNTLWSVAASGRPSRQCRECIRMRSRNRYWRNVEANRQRQNERRRAVKGGASQ